jgi:hypothetical protein
MYSRGIQSKEATMQTRTTSVALSLAVIAGVAILVSCTPETTSPESATPVSDAAVTRQKVEDLRSKYNWIGQYHSDGLAYIYSQLAKGKGKSRSKADLCRIAAKALKDFHKANFKHDVQGPLVDPSLMAESCVDAQGSRTISRTVLAGSMPGTVRNDLSPAAASYLDQMSYLTNFANSRTEFFDGIYSIEAQAANTLSPSEAGAVAAVGSIARSSADYWDANLTSWTGFVDQTAIAYSITGGPGTNGVSSIVTGAQTPVFGWRDGAKALGKVIAADIVSGARTVFTSWFVGPIAWEVAGANALWGSAVAGLALIM